MDTVTNAPAIASRCEVHASVFLAAPEVTAHQEPLMNFFGGMRNHVWLNIGEREQGAVLTLHIDDPHALAAAITAAAVQAGIPAPQPQPQASEGAAHE